MTKRRLREDLGWGLMWGLTATLFFSAWVTFVRGSSGAEPFEDLNVSYRAVVVTYVLLGIFGGLLLGALRPMSHSKWGAAVLGWVLAFVSYAGSLVLLGSPPWQWEAIVWAALTLASGLLGVTAGIVHWGRAQRDKSG
jgi:hypothetical protein